MPTDLFPAGHTCLWFQFTCENGMCVDKRRVCDGNRDCADASDEAGCNGTYLAGIFQIIF